MYEVALGTPFRTLVADAGGVTETPGAFLIGGYFGTWARPAEVASLSLLNSELQGIGASLGARAIVVFPASACGVAESARVARYLAAESAGQCGPCVHGRGDRRGLEQLSDPRAGFRGAMSSVGPSSFAAGAPAGIRTAPRGSSRARSRCSPARSSIISFRRCSHAATRVLPVPEPHEDRS